jgi:bis(5'-nucleosidyl)-tetraphosphatase
MFQPPAEMHPRPAFLTAGIVLPPMRYQRDTSAGVIVFHRVDGGACQFLLLLSRLTKRPLWEFPKGGIDPGESVIDAAMRELHEETGLDRHDVRLIDGFKESERYRFVVPARKGQTTINKQVTYYLAEALHRNVIPAAAETLDFGWFELEEAMRRVRYRERRRILGAAAAAAGCVPASLSSPDGSRTIEGAGSASSD